MTACTWWIGENDRCCWFSVEICVWNNQRKRLSYQWSINLFVALHKWGEKNKTHLTCSKTLLRLECQEESGSDVIKNHQTMRQWDSEWLNFNLIFWIGMLRNQIICVSQLTACVAVLTWHTLMWYWLHCP